MSTTSLGDIEPSNGSWKTIIINNESYSIRAVKKDGSWKIYLTDLVDLWFESLDSTKILQKCERLNPSLSIEDIDVVSFVGRLLDNIEQKAVKMSVNRIEFAEELEGGIFKFSIDFTRGNSRQLWEEVTMPLCLLAGELKRRQTLLLDLVRKKDEEITEYRLNGAELTRKHIKTEPFNEGLFKKNAPKLNAESSLSAFENIMNLCGDIELEKITVKTEPTPGRSSEGIEDREKLTIIRAEKSQSTKSNEAQEPMKILPKIETNDSPKLEKKLRTLDNEGDNEATPKRWTRSAPSLPAKRPKKTIHDFIT